MKGRAFPKPLALALPRDVSWTNSSTAHLTLSPPVRRVSGGVYAVLGPLIKAGVIMV